MNLESGTRLGPYRIDSLAGQGGMGQVYRGVDTRLDRTVAVKVLPPHLSAHPQLRERFDREARAISALSHPNICALYDVGSSDGVDYLVMEFLEGETLAARIQRGPLPVAQAIRYGIEIAEALGKAHRKGIVHRDLKPGNVMLTASGAKLLDFGLARTAAPALLSPDAPTEMQQPLTAEGTIVGTFQYMAPEQLEGEEADARTDIFALGCLLYEMVTGVRAFEGRTKTSLIAAIVASEPRPVREVQPLAPSALAHVIGRCMQKSPEERWQSAVDVAHELRWINERETQRTEDVAPRSRPGWLLPLIAMIALLLGGAIAWAAARYLTRAQPTEVVRTTIATPEGVDVFPGQADDITTISPDGRHVALTGVDPQKGRLLYVRALSESDLRVIVGSEGARHPFWSPDSRSIAFFAKGKLKRVGLDGGTPVTLTDVGSNPVAGSWSPNGTILFSPASGSPLHRIAATGGKAVPATKLDTAAGETTHRWAHFLPDGEHFLYTAGAHNLPLTHEVNAIYASRLGSETRTLVLRGRTPVSVAAGHLLFAREGRLLAQQFDVDSRTLSGEPRVIVDGVQMALPSLFAAFSVSKNGRLTYVTARPDAKVEIVRINAQGAVEAVIREAKTGFLSGNISPDGTRFAFMTDDASSGSDIWVHDLERGGDTRVTTDAMAMEPVWSPDGRRLAYSRQSDRDFYVRNMSGPPNEERLFAGDHWSGPVSWSPDGKYLSFWMFDPSTATGYDAYLLPLDGERKPLVLANSPGTDWPGSFSPDGRLLLYESDESGRYETYVASTATLAARARLSTTGGGGATWLSNDEVWFAQPDGAIVSVTVTEPSPGEFETSVPRVLFRDATIRTLHTARGRIVAIRSIESRVRTQTVLLDGWEALLK